MTMQVNIVMGGPSAEYEVSLHSGFEILTHIRKDLYKIRVVTITKSQQFYYSDIESCLPDFSELISPEKSDRFKGPFTAASSDPVWENCDIAFLALHGSYGEDGIIQGFLDTLGITYTGSGVLASAIAMDKIISKFIFIQNGFTVPPFSVFGKNFPDITPDILERKHGFPCFIKCPQSGSSRLMGRAGSKEDLVDLINDLSKHSPGLLVESSIDGPEFSCGVIEQNDGSLIPLPPVEIRPKSIFFDYKAKYTTGESIELVPAPQPEELLERIQKIALDAHRAIGCSGISRTDMILNDDSLYVLEINTLPGMTKNSLLPRAFMSCKGTYSDLIDTIINSALNKRQYGVK